MAVELAETRSLILTFLIADGWIEPCMSQSVGSFLLIVANTGQIQKLHDGQTSTAAVAAMVLTTKVHMKRNTCHIQARKTIHLHVMN